MEYRLNTVSVVSFIFLLLQVVIFSSCDLYENWRNGEPEINSLDVPEKVQYGETAELEVSAFDPEDDIITYTWHVSDGVLSSETEPTVQWTAPILTDEEVVPPMTVTVRISVKDEGEEVLSKTASIIVFSKAYEVADGLSGEYDLVLTQVDGETVENQGGIMRLTTTTFTRQFEEKNQFFFGTYSLIEPYDDKKGNMNWISDGNTIPIVSTYTWDGKLLVIYWTDTTTAHVYQKKN